MVITEHFVGGGMVKLGLESFVVPPNLVPPERPQPGDLVIKLNRRSMLKALVKQVKWTEVRSRTVDQTEKACLFRWTWVWFARTAAFKDGGETVDLCEVWGGAWYLGESGPVNPQDEGVVAILQSWHAHWPTTHGEILRLIESMGPQCRGYRRQLCGWHFGGAMELSSYIPMAKSKKQTGFFRFAAAGPSATGVISMAAMRTRVRYYPAPVPLPLHFLLIYPASLLSISPS